MQQSNGKLTGTAYADHLRGCADLAVEIAGRMDIREDSARQACFATIIINAERHNIFMEPVPRDSKTPVIQPEPAAVEPGVTTKGVETAAAEKDVQAAAKADSQIDGVPKVSTPEQDAGAKRSALLEGIEAAKTLLNKAGFTPPVTPKGLLTMVNQDLDVPGNLGTMDNDDLEKIIKYLSEKLDTFKHNTSALAGDDIDF